MKLEENDLRELYDDIERGILASSTSSAQKKIRHDYMLPNLDNFEQIYYICAAKIREEVEKVFLKYIEKDLLNKVKEDSEKRKRPRKKVEVSKDKIISTTKLGGFSVETYE